MTAPYIPSARRRALHAALAVVSGAALAVGGLAPGAATAAVTASTTTNAAPYRHGLVPQVGHGPGRATARPGSVTPNSSAGNLNFNGGIDNIGVTTGREQVYLVFWGSQWGSASTNAQGYTALSGDPEGSAPYLQAFFKGLGTGGETWSGVMTQYCQGVAAGTQYCPSSSTQHVGYPLGGALAGVWVDESAAAPAAASGHQIGVEAVNAAAHFGNTSAAGNRNAQYVVLSPTGTNPDNWLTSGYCAWHDYNGDAALSGGAVSSPYGDIAFTNLPYVGDAGANCGQGFVNSPGTLDGWSIVEGHEYAETITDQNPAGGYTDSSGYENGDKCAWISSGQGASQDVSLPTGTFAVQSTWSNDFNGGAGGCLISHPIVPNGPEIAFQSATGGLWTAIPAGGGGVNQNQGVMTGTSPSIASVPAGGYEIAYQGTNGDLWVTTLSGTPIDSHLGMMGGTSPAIAAASGGGFNVAFQANTGVLWDYTSSTGRGTSLNQGMVTSSSPSISAPYGVSGGYEIAYQGSNVDLWVTTISGTPIDSHLGMMGGTSPAIAAGSGGGFNVAFQANTGVLWDYTSSNGTGSSQGLNMKGGTSPGIA